MASLSCSCANMARRPFVWRVRRLTPRGSQLVGLDIMPPGFALRERTYPAESPASTEHDDEPDERHECANRERGQPLWQNQRQLDDGGEQHERQTGVHDGPSEEHPAYAG